MIDPYHCQHVQCRAREDRQDLQCSRRFGHTGNHSHTVAIGWCDPRWRHLAANRKGGHTNPR